MADLTSVEIAGIRFSISCQNSMTLQEPGPAYRPFFSAKADKDPEAIDIKIRLELEDMPNTERLTRIFDSGGSWSMFRDGDDYIFSLNPPGLKGQPLRLARMDRDFAQVTVYCSERLITKRDGGITVSNPLCYPLDQLLVMYILAQNGGALLHAAGIGINGRGFILSGRSGAGKSTISRQFLVFSEAKSESLGAARKDLEVLSDDRVAVRKMDGAFRAFGTPWPGDEGIALNKSVPLSGIFFIYHGDTNRVKDIEPQEALERLLPVTSIPWYDREIMPRILLFCEDLVTHIPAFELHFKPSFEVVGFLEEFVST